MSKELREDAQLIELVRQINFLLTGRYVSVNTTSIQKAIDRYAAEREREVAKAYGGCTKCYGKGYATVNDSWHGYGTDGDIGGVEGHISGGNANAMKFCKCERGKQLAARLKILKGE